VEGDKRWWSHKHSAVLDTKSCRNYETQTVNAGYNFRIKQSPELDGTEDEVFIPDPHAACCAPKQITVYVFSIYFFGFEIGEFKRSEWRNSKSDKLMGCKYRRLSSKEHTLKSKKTIGTEPC